jgi:hypothetical protein
MKPLHAGLNDPKHLKMDPSFVLALLLLLPELFECRDVILKNQGLTSFPEVVTLGSTADLVSVTLDSNEITEVVFPVGYSVTTLSMKSNRLTEFPDVRSIGHSLTSLLLRFNKIAYVDPNILSALDVLDYLHLGNNQLTYFPDTSNPTPVLSALRLYYNQLEELPYLPNYGKSITEFPIGNNPMHKLHLRSFRSLKKITSMGMANMTAEVVPNLCHVKQGSLSLSNFLYLKCDCHFKWYKLVDPAGIMVATFDDAPCYATQQLTGIPYSSIQPQQLACAGKEVMTLLLTIGHHIINCWTPVGFPALLAMPSMPSIV